MTSTPTTDGATGQSAGRRAWPTLSGKTIFSLLIVAIALWFVLANTESARIRIFLVTLSSPMWLVLALTFGGGWLGGMFYVGRRRRKQQHL